MADEDLLPLTFDQNLAMMAGDILTSSFNGANGGPGGTITDLVEGSVAETLLSALAGPLEEINSKIAIDLPKTFFADEAKGEKLEKVLGNLSGGLYAKVKADYGAGDLLVTGTPGANFPTGTELVTPGDVVVATLFPLTLPAEGFARVAAQAKEKGASGNLLAGTTLAFKAATPSGIDAVTVPDRWSGGADEQSDESYLAGFPEFMDSLARGVRTAIMKGAREAGYDRSFVQEPGAGLVRIYVDDGAVPSAEKIANAKAIIGEDWRAQGAVVKVLARLEKAVNLRAVAFTDGTVPLATLQADIAARWAALFAAKRQGDGLRRIDLITAASRAPGYNGLNLLSPTIDVTVQAPTNEYWTVFGPGEMKPYEKLVLGTLDWGVA